ncbi:MAG: IclR family transcriptional regulator [Pyrinomonadaceae bacterium]|nr:IclR family transcriptional regulator [Pyrinomonadaceae bacterium]
MSEEKTANAVERTFSILELVAESTNGLSNSDISRRLNVPKSSASYILRVMEKRGYLIRGDGGKYRLGLKLMSLSRGQIAHADVREVAKPILEQFLRKSRMSEAHLAVLDNGRAVYVEKVEAENSFIKMDIWVGHRLPVHTTAIGKVLVANLADAEIVKILDLRGMEKKTRKSITNQAKFLQEIAKVREYGAAIDNEENSANVRCLAAPIYDANGLTVAALGTSSTILQLDETNLPKVIALVKEAASKVSEQLGYSGKR